MTFWNWRRGPGAAGPAGSVAIATGPELAPVELYTAGARIVGWIESRGRRVTDLLNTSTELRLWHPSPGPIESGGILPAEPGDAPGDWQSIPTETVLLAMPPEWRASRQLRLHRRLRRVALSVGPFAVTGNVHLPPGADAGPGLLRRADPFMPLTDAYLLHNADPPFEHVVSVLIVNTTHVTQLTPLVSLA